MAIISLHGFLQHLCFIINYYFNVVYYYYYEENKHFIYIYKPLNLFKMKKEERKYWLDENV